MTYYTFVTVHLLTGTDKDALLCCERMRWTDEGSARLWLGMAIEKWCPVVPDDSGEDELIARPGSVVRELQREGMLVRSIWFYDRDEKRWGLIDLLEVP